jgi:P27 family predicted phage terminase small subunit
MPAISQPVRIDFVQKINQEGAMPAEPKPPEHLSKRSKAFWRKIAARYELETEHFEVLRKALEASDRADEAGEVLRREGITITDRYGTVKPHPATSVELHNRAAFLKLLEALKLGQDEAGSTTTPARQLVRKRWQGA